MKELKLTERDRLIKYLRGVIVTTDEGYTLDDTLTTEGIGMIADEILADRRRVLEPLLKEKEKWTSRHGWSPDFYPNQKCIDATLKLAGLGEV